MPFDLRSLIYGSSSSNNNNNTGNNENVASENDGRPKTSSDKQQQHQQHQQQEQLKRKRVRIAKEGDETTKKMRKTRTKLHTAENDSDDGNSHEEDVSLQSQAAHVAAATVAGLSTEIDHDEYDEKAAEAAKRLKKTTAHLQQLFGQSSSNGDGDADDSNSRASNDEEAVLDDDDDDVDAMALRKPPPTTITAAATAAAAPAAPATTTTTTVSTDDNNTEETDKAETIKTRKRKVMTEEEKVIHERLRHKKLERFREWECVRNRWKGRKVDLRNEQDVGNAIHRTILRLHKERQQQQQQQADEEEAVAAAVALRESQRHPPPAAAAAAANDKNNKNNNNNDLNSTDEEQEILLNRLLQGNAQARQAAAAAAGPGDNSSDIVPDTIESTLARPYAERGLDYWEMGNTRPRRQKFPHIRYVPTFERIIVKPKAKRRTTTTNANQKQQRESDIAVAARKNAAYEAENDRLGFYSFPSTTTMPLEEFHASAWPLSHPSRNVRTGPEHGWFFHRRLVLRLAARQLVGAPVPSNSSHDGTTTSAMSSTNNRLIRALWNTKLADSHRQSLLLSEAQNAGVRMEAFLTHVWKDRTMAANLLGVSTAASSTVRIGGEQRGQAAVMAGLPVAFMGTTLRPYTDLCKAHIERLVRHASTGQRIDWEPNSKHGINRKQRGRQHFTAITSYIPTPGTEPPIPCFPLDETQCIFGPMDKNATAQHASYFTDGQDIPTVDDTVYRITLSTLLARWATAIASAPSAATGARTTTTSNSSSFLLDDDDKGLDENNQKNNSYRFTAQDQIERMVQQTVDLNKNNKYKRLGPLCWLEDAEDGLPLVPLYRAMLGYCSLEVSGYREQRGSGSHDNNRWDDNGCDDDDSYSRRLDNASNNKVTLKDIAQETVHFCEKHQDHNGLLSFPKLHMILALLGLSTELPESGVEILAQPLDEMQHQTSFDIMRNLLEHLEEEEFISNNVAILEFAMYQAAERFGRCVQKDPAQVSYHTWHLGTLAGCLLLCSGNRIGSGARRFPSSLSASSSSSVGTSSQDRLRRSLGGDSNDDIDSPQHEVRRKLPKFHELRIETARAFRLLLQLAKYQQSPRCNLAVASFLEWRQVIALMLGPPSFVDFYYDPFEDIRSLHSRHFNDLMLSGQASSDALTEFQRRMSTKRSNRDCRLTFLANTLERDPGRLENWRALVRALGPVGVRVDPARRESCADCQECHRVHKNLNIDHESFNHDRDCNCGGWANNRLDWWDSHLLHVTKEKVGENIETAMFCSIVESQLESMSVVERSAEFGDEDEAADSAPSLKWLENIISSDLFDNPNAPAPSAEDREQIYDMDLPASLLESSHDDSDSETDPSREVDDIPLMSPFPFDDGAAEKNEILCYKLAVTCHMYGLFHPHVDRILVALFNNCWDGAQQELQTDCTAWTCITWLYSWVGLDVLAPIRQALLSQPHVNAAVADARLAGAQVKRRRVKKSDDAAYPDVMCEAVREGIQLFGFKKWTKIHRQFPDIFDGCGRRKAQECYTYMVEKGLMEKIDDARYPAAMCEAVREGIQMCGLKWAAIQRHFPDVFEKFHLKKAQECYKYMIKTGLIEPIQIDESDVESMGCGGGGYDDDDDDDDGAANMEELGPDDVRVGQKAIGMPTNPIDLERVAVRILQETSSKENQQAPSPALQQPPTEADASSSPPKVASKLTVLETRSPSTGAAPGVPGPTAAPTARMPPNAKKNAVPTVVRPRAAPKVRKSRTPRPVTKTLEDFEREALINMQRASQKWFPGYNPPEKTDPPAAIQRRTTAPEQPHSESQVPHDPTPQHPVELGLPPAVPDVEDSGSDSDKGAAFAEV